MLKSRTQTTIRRNCPFCVESFERFNRNLSVARNSCQTGSLTVGRKCCASVQNSAKKGLNQASKTRVLTKRAEVRFTVPPLLWWSPSPESPKSHGAQERTELCVTMMFCMKKWWLACLLVFCPVVWTMSFLHRTRAQEKQFLRRRLFNHFPQFLFV